MECGARRLAAARRYRGLIGRDRETVNHRAQVPANPLATRGCVGRKYWRPTWGQRACSARRVPGREPVKQILGDILLARAAAIPRACCSVGFNRKTVSASAAGAVVLSSNPEANCVGLILGKLVLGSVGLAR